MKQLFLQSLGNMLLVEELTTSYDSKLVKKIIYSQVMEHYLSSHESVALTDMLTSLKTDIVALKNHKRNEKIKEVKERKYKGKGITS